MTTPEDNREPKRGSEGTRKPVWNQNPPKPKTTPSASSTPSAAAPKRTGGSLARPSASGLSRSRSSQGLRAQGREQGESPSLRSIQGRQNPSTTSPALPDSFLKPLPELSFQTTEDSSASHEDPSPFQPGPSLFQQGPSPFQQGPSTSLGQDLMSIPPGFSNSPPGHSSSLGEDPSPFPPFPSGPSPFQGQNPSSFHSVASSRDTTLAPAGQSPQSRGSSSRFEPPRAGQGSREHQPSTSSPQGRPEGGFQGLIDAAHHALEGAALRGTDADPDRFLEYAQQRQSSRAAVQKRGQDLLAERQRLKQELEDSKTARSDRAETLIRIQILQAELAAANKKAEDAEKKVEAAEKKAEAAEKKAGEKIQAAEKKAKEKVKAADKEATEAFDELREVEKQARKTRREARGLADEARENALEAKKKLAAAERKLIATKKAYKTADEDREALLRQVS